MCVSDGKQTLSKGAAHKLFQHSPEGQEWHFHFPWTRGSLTSANVALSWKLTAAALVFLGGTFWEHCSLPFPLCLSQSSSALQESVSIYYFEHFSHSSVKDDLEEYCFEWSHRDWIITRCWWITGTSSTEHVVQVPFCSGKTQISTA